MGCMIFLAAACGLFFAISAVKRFSATDFHNDPQLMSKRAPTD
jgi:hypothetical protein